MVHYRWTHSMPLIPISWKSTLILPSHLHLGLSLPDTKTNLWCRGFLEKLTVVQLVNRHHIFTTTKKKKNFLHRVPKNRQKQTDMSGDASDLHVGITQFEPPSGHKLSLLKFYCYFPQLLQARAVTESQRRPRHFPSTSVPSHYSQPLATGSVSH